MILLLHIDLSSQLFKILVGLLEDLKKSGVLLSIDHIDIGIEVVILEGLNSVPLVLVLHHLLLLFLGLKRRFNKDSLLTNMVYLFLVKLSELFGVQKDFIEELSVASLFPVFLARAHLLLKAIQGSCLLFAVGIYLCPLVKLPVNQLSLKQVVALGLLPELIQRHFVVLIASKNLGSELTLQRFKLNHLHGSLCLLPFVLRCVRVVNDVLKL